MRAMLSGLFAVVVMHFGAGLARAERMLLVVNNAASLTADESAEVTQFETWGWEVTPISKTATQTQFDVARRGCTLIYVGEKPSVQIYIDLILNSPAGMVMEEHTLTDIAGQMSGSVVSFQDDEIDITDTGHYITEGLAGGVTAIYTSVKAMSYAAISWPASMTLLGQRPGTATPVLTCVESGAVFYPGYVAGARRVCVPWGYAANSLQGMNATGLSLLSRSMRWASAPGTLLFVVPDSSSLSADAQSHVDLFHEWGWVVTTISDTATASQYAQAAADADVAFITQEVTSGNIGTKLNGLSIGIVSEENALFDDFGLTSQSGNTGGATSSITVTDHTHYLTAEYSNGAVTILSAPAELSTRNGTMAAGAQSLANYTGGSGSVLDVLEGGATLVGGGRGVWRRVFLPWGPSSNSFAALNENGKTLLWRSLSWASKKRYEQVSFATGFYPTTSTDDDWGSGLHWADLDGDGDLDAIAGGDSGSKKLINNGATFASSTMGNGTVYRQGGLVDLDNDGDLDYWGMTHYNTEIGYTNNGSGSLSSAGDLGLPNPSNMEGVALADVDGDGWCDVVVFAENGTWIGHHQGEVPVALVGTIDSSYGLNDSGDYGNGDYCSSADVNNDGYPDFFYHYDGGKLFISNGDGTYTQNNFGISITTGNDLKIGSAWGDYDNDGDVDLWVGRFASGSTGYLWRNDRDWEAGAGSFTNQVSGAGVSNTVGTRGCSWGDYDNDGDLDLLLATVGSSTDLLVYRNEGNGSFVRCEEGLALPADAQDIALADYDLDGDLDMACTVSTSVGFLARNDTNDDAHLEVRVIGAGAGKTNTAAVGVRAELWSADGSVYLGRREIGTARGFGGTEPMWAHFGGVDPDDTYQLKVYFTGGFVYSGLVTPSLASTTIGGTTIDQMVTIDESLVRTRARVVQWEEVSPY